MEVVELICPQCKAVNRLKKYWKGSDAPDHKLKCNECKTDIPVNQKQKK